MFKVATDPRGALRLGASLALPVGCLEQIVQQLPRITVPNQEVQAAEARFIAIT